MVRTSSVSPAPPNGAWAATWEWTTLETSPESWSLTSIRTRSLDIVQPDCPLFRGVASGSYVYFVHSFYPQPTDASIAATRTNYGDTFVSSVWKVNVYATQFHPEKSQVVGLKILQNFVELVKSKA